MTEVITEQRIIPALLQKGFTLYSYTQEWYVLGPLKQHAVGRRQIYGRDKIIIYEVAPSQEQFRWLVELPYEEADNIIGDWNTYEDFKVWLASELAIRKALNDKDD